jgi:uncharacterized membrane protein
MSNLIVVAFDDESTAFRVRDKLGQLQAQYLIKLDDLAVAVRHQDGEVKIKQATNLVGSGALGGAFWGMLIGLIFFIPFFGLAIGAATGAIAGKFSDYGIDDKFIKAIADGVQPGQSAIFALVREATPDKVLDALGEFQGRVIQTSLTSEQEQRLKEAFGDVAAA